MNRLERMFALDPPHTLGTVDRMLAFVGKPVSVQELEPFKSLRKKMA